MSINQFESTFEIFVKLLNSATNESSPAAVTTIHTAIGTNIPQVLDSKRTPQGNNTHISTTTTSTTTPPFYHLILDSQIKFIELKRKLAALTHIYANNQEWYVYQLNFTNNDGGTSSSSELRQTGSDYVTETAKELDPASSVEGLIAEEKIFNIPLTLIVEEKSTLEQLCTYTDDLIKQSTHSASAKSSFINDSDDNIVKMFFVLVNKGGNVASLLSEDMFINDEDIQIEEDVDTMSRQQIKRISSIDLTRNDSIEELQMINYSNSGSGGGNGNKSARLENQANAASHFANPSAPNAGVVATSEDIGDEVVVEDEDNYEIIDHNNDDDDDDVHFLAEETDNRTTKKHKGLISTDCLPADELACTNSFSEEFTARYGHLAPLFYIGSFEQALKDALFCPAKERKLFGVYLHSDNTIFSHIFCTKTLCDENVINFLSSNFIVWPWDLSLKQYEEHFYQISSRALNNGSNNNNNNIISSVKELKERLPALIIITRSRGNNEITAIIEGDCSNEMLMNRLMQACELFEMTRAKDERDEASRDEREQIKREQDAAYQASLESDKAKRQKQEEEMEKEKEKERDLERKKVEARNSVPAEPTDSETTSITRIRFRLPSGEFVQRKFYITNKLKALVDFVTGLGYFSDKFKLLSSWPRKDLTAESQDRTIEDLKLFPQETLTLEER